MELGIERAASSVVSKAKGSRAGEVLPRTAQGLDWMVSESLPTLRVRDPHQRTEQKLKGNPPDFSTQGIYWSWIFTDRVSSNRLAKQ